MSTPNRFAAGAVDLGQLGQRQAPQQQQPGQLALVANVTPESFENDVVINSTKVIVVVHVGSSRSPESEQMKQDFHTLVSKQNAEDLSTVQWLFRYVDVDQHPEIAQAFKVQAVPTVIALAAGRPLTQFEGAENTENLQQWIAAIVQAVDGKLPGLGEAPADPRLDQASQLLESGDTDGAIAIYDELLTEDPKNEEAKAARAHAVVLSRTEGQHEGEANDPFARADQLIMAGNKSEAFDVLIEEIKNSSGADQDAAKERLFELFAMFEAGDPDVIAARTSMASALF